MRLINGYWVDTSTSGTRLINGSWIVIEGAAPPPDGGLSAPISLTSGNTRPRRRGRGRRGR